MKGLIAAIGALLKLLTMWFSPEETARRRRAALLKKMESLEAALGLAYALGDATEEARITAELHALREKIRILGD